MKKIFFYIAFIFSVAAFGQNEQQAQLLEDAYKKRSDKKATEFFKNWQQELPTINDKELAALNDTLRETYNVFTAFYNGQLEKNINYLERYLILQNSIKISFTDKIYYSEEETDNYVTASISRMQISEKVRDAYLRKFDGKYPEDTVFQFGPRGDLNSNIEKAKERLIDSIICFRPMILNGKRQVVYLTEGYEKLLIGFLGSNSSQPDIRSVNYISERQSKKRYKFLNQFVPLKFGHWFGYLIVSYPKASAIVFDNDMNYARIDYVSGYAGHEAVLKNDNGNWTIISCKMTWIQ